MNKMVGFLVIYSDKDNMKLSCVNIIEIICCLDYFCNMPERRRGLNFNRVVLASCSLHLKFVIQELLESDDAASLFLWTIREISSVSI